MDPSFDEEGLGTAKEILRALVINSRDLNSDAVIRAYDAVSEVLAYEQARMADLLDA